MTVEFNDRVLEYRRIPQCVYFVKLEQDKGSESGTDLKNKMPAHLGSFISFNSKGVITIFYVKLIYSKGTLYKIAIPIVWVLHKGIGMY